MTGRACARPVHTLPTRLLLLRGGRRHRRRRRLGSRGRRGRTLRRGGGLRRLLPAGQYLLPLDLIEVRAQLGVLGIASHLLVDEESTCRQDGETLTTDEVRVGDAFQYRPKLVLDLAPLGAVTDGLL